MPGLSLPFHAHFARDVWGNCFQSLNLRHSGVVILWKETLPVSFLLLQNLNLVSAVMDPVGHKLSQVGCPGKQTLKQRSPCRVSRREGSEGLCLRKAGKDRTGQRGVCEQVMQSQQRFQLTPWEFCIWQGPLESSILGPRGMGLYKEPACLHLYQSWRADIISGGLTLGEAASAAPWRGWLLWAVIGQLCLQRGEGTFPMEGGSG